MNNKNSRLDYSIGVFDSEGCISIGIGGTKKSERIYFTGMVQLSITNCNNELITKVKKDLLFPNKIYIQKPRKQGHTPLYQIIAQKPSDILKIISLVDFQSLRRSELELAKRACGYIINVRKHHYYWNYGELDTFERTFVDESHRTKGNSANRGRPHKYNWRKILGSHKYK